MRGELDRRCVSQVRLFLRIYPRYGLPLGVITSRGRFVTTSRGIGEILSNVITSGGIPSETPSGYN